MLDVRATLYVSPLSEVEFTDVPLTVRLVNNADETAYITGHFRVYNDTTSELIFDSYIAPLTLAPHISVDASALTDFSPPAPADDTYFVLFDGNASNELVPRGVYFHLGAFYFDVKPGPLGTAPAAHAVSHEQAGADPIDTEDLGTAELDPNLTLHPDGAGGLSWAATTPAGHHATHEDGGSDQIDVNDMHGADEFLRTDGANPLTAYLDVVEMAPPGNPAANSARIYAEDFKGFTLLSFRDNTGMVRKLVRDSVIIGKNITGSPIPAGSAVYATGSSGNVPTIAPARANALATMPCIGVTVEAIADNAFGRIMQVGLLENINTNSLTEGNAVFVDSAVAGGIVATPPTYPNIRQELGSCLVKSVGAGALQIIARSMLYEPYIDHTGLLNLTTGDPHTQYQKESEKGTASGYPSLPNPLDTTTPIRADGTPALSQGAFFQLEFLYQYALLYSDIWRIVSLSSGTLTALAGLAKHPGIATIASSTSANSGVSIRTDNTSILLSGNEDTYFIFKPDTLAGTVARMGFHDSPSTGGPTDGAYLIMSQVGGVDGTIQGRTVSNSVATLTATSYALSSGTWYIGRVKVNSDATRVDFYIYDEDGSLLWSDYNTANIPTSAGRELGHACNWHNSGTTAVNLVHIDYISLWFRRQLGGRITS